MLKLVVVNSTPIIALSGIDKLSLFREMYGKITIPTAVKSEISFKSKSKAHYQLSAASDWILIQEIKNISQKQIFKTQLHDGEVEVMILGQELNADLLVIDYFAAREYAKYLGFNVVGTLGVILKAKSEGYLKEIKPLVDGLITNGIYISNRLYADIMKIANE